MALEGTSPHQPGSPLKQQHKQIPLGSFIGDGKTMLSSKKKKKNLYFLINIIANRTNLS